MNLRDYFMSAGFGGAAALAAALILALIAFFAARRTAKRDRAQAEQQERRHAEVRADEQRTTAIARCWERFVWVVETAGIEPATSENATLGLGPELALELLRGLLRDAEQLGDDTLAKAVAVYLNQFSLVLAQQAGSLASLAAPDPTPGPAESAPQPVPQAPPPPVADSGDVGSDGAADSTTTKGRRRRG
ncbi:hypothetical protein [Mycobacterium bourgelatii]|uniref:Uncharacterized protein n=1 Tax=Mycobacterium bourgelatii TaxID=1273442 RepID=A0A7I9YNR7_MYCBU|nr:hypothetical protein [Mycobacterium bourgelatii]MCV6976003.1 hypothetical protein [Mycobacterium bourgelatii]GFG90267.1 hypothetical protein MBOU_23090 [Mycobacterium bourgelatii]